MTPIPYDDPYEEKTANDRISEAGARAEDVATRAEDSTRRIAAAIAGALEGFVEALDRYDLAGETERAARQAGDITRSAAVEGQTLAHTPEMEQVGEGLRTAGHKAGEVVHGATDSVRSAAHSARETARRVKEGVTVRAEAVVETGRRARSAPRIIGRELSEAFAVWKRALMTSLVTMLALAIFAATALVVLTIALVVGLNEVLGDPAGTFVVALLYVVVAGIAFGIGKAARARAALEREERMANAREEVRHVVRPLREAFSRGRPGI